MERELQKIPPDERSRRAKKIQDELEAWKNVEVKLAVIGGTGVGKSTYINRMRGVTYKDKDTKDSRGQNLYAPVGLNETTMEIKEYEYQDNPLIRLYDLPGAGTENFPLATYVEDVQMDQFDAFVCLTKDRFTENDVAIMKEIKFLGKPLFTARTHADVDCQKFLNENPDSFSLQTWAAEQNQLKDFINEKLGQRRLNAPVYHILCSVRSKKKFYHDDWEEDKSVTVEFKEFETMKLAIIDSLPELQKSALLFSLGGPKSEEEIERIYEALRSRIWKVAAASACVGAIPVPGVSITFDASAFAVEMAHQMKCLGLDPVTLTKKAELLKRVAGQDLETLILEEAADNVVYRKILSIMMGSTSSNLEEQVKDGSFLNHLNEFRRWMPVHGSVAKAGALRGTGLIASEMAEEVFKFALPVVGSVIAGAISGCSMYISLSSSLNCYKRLSKTCLAIMKRHVI